MGVSFTTSTAGTAQAPRADAGLLRALRPRAAAASPAPSGQRQPYFWRCASQTVDHAEELFVGCSAGENENPCVEIDCVVSGKNGNGNYDVHANDANTNGMITNDSSAGEDEC